MIIVPQFRPKAKENFNYFSGLDAACAAAKLKYYPQNTADSRSRISSGTACSDDPRNPLFLTGLCLGKNTMKAKR